MPQENLSNPLAWPQLKSEYCSWLLNGNKRSDFPIMEQTAQLPPSRKVWGSNGFSPSWARRLGNKLAGQYNNTSSGKKLISNFLSGFLSIVILPQCPASMQPERPLLWLLMFTVVTVLQAERVGKQLLTITFKQTDAAEISINISIYWGPHVSNTTSSGGSLLLGKACASPFLIATVSGACE